MPLSAPRFRLCVLLIAATLAVGGAGYCGDSLHPLDQFKGEQGVDPRIEQLRRHMDELFTTHSEALIKEQASVSEKADATLVMGLFLLVGRVGRADPVEAAGYLRRAAEMGCPEAALALGNLYAIGVETDSGRIERDPEKARSWFERSAAGGVAGAMVALGDIYADGQNVDPDSKKALAYYVDAAKRGDPMAISRLEPVMRNAREWEAARPGRKANFPTSEELLVDKELARQAKGRALLLERFSSGLYVELNKRIAASSGIKRN